MTKKTPPGDQESQRWDRVERIWIRVERFMLILTFFCTVAATIYSAKTADKALQESQLSLRPWVTVPEVETTFKDDQMKTRFRVVNIGKVPAYFTYEQEGECNGKKMTIPKDKQLPLYGVAIMPEQTIWIVGAVVEGESYQKILSGDFDGELTQWLRVSYGTSKEDPTDYFTYQRIVFDISDMPSDLKDAPHLGIWDIVDTDFR
jgi:hypothetical protein